MMSRGTVFAVSFALVVRHGSHGGARGACAESAGGLVCDGFLPGRAQSPRGRASQRATPTRDADTRTHARNGTELRRPRTALCSALRRRAASHLLHAHRIGNPSGPRDTRTPRRAERSPAVVPLIPRHLHGAGMANASLRRCAGRYSEDAFYPWYSARP